MNIQDTVYDPLNRMPIFVNPTFDEILILAANRWGTIRILSSETELILASGYGNTHSSMITRLRLHRNRRQLDYDSYILYHEHNTAYFNLEDVSGNDRASFRIWKKYFTEDQVALLRDLIRESELTLG